MNNSVLMISGTYPPKICGIADYTRLLTHALCDKDFDITVLSGKSNQQEQWPVIGMGNHWGFKQLRSILRRVRKTRPAIVHLQYQAGIYNDSSAICFLPLMLRVFTNARIITTFHDLNGPNSWKKLHRLGAIMLLLGSHKCIVCSNRQLSGLKRLPLIGRKIRQIPVGPTVIPKDISNQRVQLQRDTINILVFGFIWRKRGLESVISACSEAAKHGHQIHLTFAGGITDSNYARKLKILSAALGLDEDQFILTGEQSEKQISRLMRETDFCILPFPTGVSGGRSTFASCAVHSLPIITTYDPANCPTELRHGENVLLYKPDDIDELTVCVKNLCSNAELRQLLATNIGEAVCNTQWPSIAEAHAHVYEE